MYESADALDITDMLSLMTDSLSSEPPEPSFPNRIEKFNIRVRHWQFFLLFFRFSQISILYNFLTIGTNNW